MVPILKHIDDLLAVYWTDPMFSHAATLLSVIMLYTWLSSVIRDNYSVVDRLWSIVPGVYSFFFFFHAYYSAYTSNMTDSLTSFAYSHPRLSMLVIMPLLWGLSLTHNFWRKGGYASDYEDYRWSIIRGRINNEFIFQIFNIFFIVFFQHLQLFLLTIACYYAAAEAVAERVVPVTSWDIFIFSCWCVCFLVELVANQEQWFFYLRRDKWRAQVAAHRSRSGDKQRGLRRDASRGDLNAAESGSEKSDAKNDERENSIRSRKSHAADAADANNVDEVASEEKIVDVNGDLRRGFNSHGSFAYSRHPHYWAEQSMWVLVGLMGISADASKIGMRLQQQLTELGVGETLGDIVKSVGDSIDFSKIGDSINTTITSLLHPSLSLSSASFSSLLWQYQHWLSLLGPILLVILFHASTSFSESISLSKYPEYATYQANVSRFLPLPASRKEWRK